MKKLYTMLYVIWNSNNRGQQVQTDFSPNQGSYDEDWRSAVRRAGRTRGPGSETSRPAPAAAPTRAHGSRSPRYAKGQRAAPSPRRAAQPPGRAGFSSRPPIRPPGRKGRIASGAHPKQAGGTKTRPFPLDGGRIRSLIASAIRRSWMGVRVRSSEEHTSKLQSLS